MIKYGKTKQFRDVIRDIAHTTRFRGIDPDTNEPIYVNDPLPTLKFRGSVKLHGTNAGISWSADKGLVMMSRNNVVTSGHFGFPEMIIQEEKAVNNIIVQAAQLCDLQHGETVSIYGEWAGPGVQTGVGISNIERKTWFIFAIKVTDVEGNGRWIEEVDQITSKTPRIRNIHEFLTFSMDIDLNNPGLVQNDLINYTNDVEELCPVAGALKAIGIGEGVVWEAWYKGHRFNFKVKGEKHSSSKVKKLAPVDPEKAKSVSDFVDYAITPNRVKQAMFEVAAAENIPESELSRKHTGSIIKWIANDVITEEAETMKNSMIEWKDVGKRASDTARRILFDFLDNRPI